MTAIPWAGRTGRIAGVVLILALLLGGPARADPDGDRALARRRYDEGLAAVDRGDLEEALAAFQEAYRLRPHPLVLYNVGQAYAALGRPREAVEALERYLKEAGSTAPADRRETVAQQILALKAKLPPPPQSPPPPAPILPSDTELSSPAAVARPSNAGAYGLTAGGLAILGGALGLRLWNDGRYRQWQSDSGSLSRAVPPRSAAEAEVIDAQRMASNNRLGQIRRSDTVGWMLLAAGTAAVVSGAIWWLSQRPSSGHRLAGGGHLVGW
jgi:tetratricopeptide (TPR) repeat protein